MQFPSAKAPVFSGLVGNLLEFTKVAPSVGGVLHKFSTRNGIQMASDSAVRLTACHFRLFEFSSDSCQAISTTCDRARRVRRVRKLIILSCSRKMFSNASSVVVCASSFLYTCYILSSLTYFLSNHGNAKLRVDDSDVTESILWFISTDAFYLAIFVCQHSLMSSDFVKHLLSRLRIDHLDRSIYNACSSASLHLLIKNWQQVPTAILWKIDTLNDITWILFSSLHVFAWSIIYSGCIMMDIAELSGVKQVWYTTYGRNNLLSAKSQELRRYMKHMRHPSFTGFLLVLWIHPLMTIDRLLMATVLTVYMALMWTIDSEDYNYHMRYYKRKQLELS